MQPSPFIAPIRLLGPVFIALTLVACVPTGSDNDGDDDDDMAPEPTMMGNGGADLDPMPPNGGGAEGTDPVSPIEDGTLGAGCNTHGDCASGFCVAGLPGGYCTQACQMSDDCGPTGSCWDLGVSQRLCLLNCESNADCREAEGYVCGGDSTCVPPGSGGGGGGGPGMGSSPGVPVGETVEDFSLTNCATGEQVSMRTFFADQRAGLFVLTAGWCGACSQWIPQVLGLMAEPQNEGLQTAFVLGETSSRTQATQRECQQYGAGHNIPPENLFMDHDGTNAFRGVFAKILLYTNEGGGFGLPWNAVINPQNWEYIYSDGGPGGSLNGAFDTLLR